MSTGPSAYDASPSIAGTVFDDPTPELTRVYAEALVGAATKDGQTDASTAVLDELDELVADVWKGQPQFAAMMRSPSVSDADKDRILVEAFEGRALPTLVRFLRVLNRHGRLGLLEAVARRARAIWDQRQNRQPVLVRSAVPLDDGQVGVLRDRLARMIQGTPVLRLDVDPSLVGGLVVQVGDHVFDASLNTRLGELRQRLMEGKSHEISSRRDRFYHPA